jgi:hypothetical protein
MQIITYPHVPQNLSGTNGVITTLDGNTWYISGLGLISDSVLTTVSGDIVSQIGVGGITLAVLTTTSGDIVDQIPSLSGYATQIWTNTNFIDNSELTTTSGDIVSQIGGGVSLLLLTTTSGDIVSQIPSLSGYATQVWVNNQSYITLPFLTTVSGDIVSQIAEAGISLEQLTTTSGDIVSQIPSLVGYATQSWANTTFIDTNEMTTISGDLVSQMDAGGVTLEQLTTTSGDIVAQFGEVTGASESWVNDNFISNSEMTTVSGDIVAQISGGPGGEVTLAMLTTTSGDIIDYVDEQISSIPSGPSSAATSATISGTAGELLVKYDIVYENPTDGKYYKTTQSGTPYEADAIGIVTATSITMDALGEITLEGQVTNVGWNWSEGLTIYVDTTKGAITQTAPTTSGYYVKPLGQALESATVWFQPELGWQVGTIAGATTVVNVPVPGPLGPTGSGLIGLQGVAGPMRDNYTTQGTGGATLSRFKVVYQDYTDLGKYKLANSDVEAKADACGLVTEVGGIDSDAVGEITLWGAVTYDGWSWVAGKPIYLDDVDGSFSQNTPSGIYTKPLGRAITTSGIWWQPELGWLNTTVTGTTGNATVVGTNGTLYIEVEHGIITVLQFT